MSVDPPSGMPSRVLRFGDAETPWLGMYVGHDGKTYRSKGEWTKKGVNSSHALDDIHNYVRDLGEKSLRQPHDPLKDIPYQSIHDYVETMRASCCPGGPFTWAGENNKYNQFLAIALHHLPPGKAMLIKNDAPIPDKYLMVGKNWPGDDRSSGKFGGESGNPEATKPPGAASDVSMILAVNRETLQPQDPRASSRPKPLAVDRETLKPQGQVLVVDRETLKPPVRRAAPRRTASTSA